MTGSRWAGSRENAWATATVAAVTTVFAVVEWMLGLWWYLGTSGAWALAGELPLRLLVGVVPFCAAFLLVLRLLPTRDGSRLPRVLVHGLAAGSAGAGAVAFVTLVTQGVMSVFRGTYFTGGFPFFSVDGGSVPSAVVSALQTGVGWWCDTIAVAILAVLLVWLRVIPPSESSATRAPDV
jgi:hypothetical protein